MPQLTLKELIEYLKAKDKTLILPEGFGPGASYRGYYDEIAFVPAHNVSVSTMLHEAQVMVGSTIYGKSQHGYSVTEDTLVNIAKWDLVTDEDEITTERLDAMFEKAI